MAKLHVAGILTVSMAMIPACAQEEKADKEDNRTASEEPTAQIVGAAEGAAAEDLSLTTVLASDDFATDSSLLKYDFLKNDVAFPSAWRLRTTALEGNLLGAKSTEIRVALAKPTLPSAYSVSASLTYGGILENMQAAGGIISALVFNYKSASDHYLMYVITTNTLVRVNGINKKRLDCAILKRVPGGTYGSATAVAAASVKSGCGYYDSSVVPMKVTVNGASVTIENTAYPALKWSATLKTSCPSGCKAGMLGGAPGFGAGRYDNFLLTAP